MKQQQPGFVLLMTLMMLVLVIVITNRIFDGGISSALYAQAMVDRERARQVALSGIQLAMGQIDISMTATTQADQKEAQPPAAPSNPKGLLMMLLPVLNRWQTVPLTEKEEGIAGELKVCIMSEDGKLNLNQVYDWSKKKFIGEDQAKGDYKKFMEETCKRLREFVGEDLFAPLEKFLKERGRPIDDVTELLQAKEFSVFKSRLFYEPSIQPDAKPPVYLLDVFTVHSEKGMEPWLLSDSWCGILGLQRAQAGDVKKRKESVAAWLKEFKPGAAWATDWDRVLKPVYGKDFSSLPKDIDSVLRAQFESKTFSVLSYGKVGDVTQRIYAVIELSPSTEKRSRVPLRIKSIYWI